MKLHVFGSCAGTEPKVGRRHVSFAIEIESGLYWFDAGEGCSYTAHLMGVDLLRVRKVFITHPHMDHVGGLGNLLWNIRKQTYVRSAAPLADVIDVYMPNMETWDGIWKILKNTEGGFASNFDIKAHKVQEGSVLKQEDISVSCVHNNHMPMYQDGSWQSFSYKIEVEGKVIIFSGDVKNFWDLSPLIENGCDVLLMETGHHSVSDVCAAISQSGKDIKNLFFIHNGRDILKDPISATLRAQEQFKGKSIICEDATTIEI